VKRTIDSTIDSGGVRIAVREHSPSGPDRPTVVLVHGYPDRQDMWGPVVAALPTDRLHVVTYDVRGAGRSDAPEELREYRTDRLVDDLAAVLDAVEPDGRTGPAVHLVGHDWGSVQLWDAVGVADRHPGLRDRLASFTSISGPSLAHGAWLSRHPHGRRLRLLRQLGHSWYVYLFLVPVLPELAWRVLHRPLSRVIAAKEGLGRGHWGAGLGRDAVHGLRLYRANVPAGIRRDLEPWRTDVPVQVVRPTRDAYLTGVILEDLDRIASDVRVVEVDAGHWVARTHPEVVAALVTEHVDRTDGVTRA
jgi:pimeloyl-ACP methyl ester carboxylesterase